MKLNQLKGIHSWIRNAETSEVLFIGVLVFPLYLLFYDKAFEIMFPDYKNFILILATILYIAGITWMKLVQSKNENDEKHLVLVKNFILDKNYTFMSFEKLAAIDIKVLDEERIKELVYLFPEELRFANLKENKKGIKVLKVEQEK